MSDQDNNDQTQPAADVNLDPQQSAKTEPEAPLAEGEQNESCLNCKYWLYENAMTERGPLGLCRQSPPKVFMIPAPQASKPNKQQPPNFFSQFPPMLFDGWCGQWKKTDRNPIDVIAPQPPIPVDVPMGNVTPLGNRRK